MISRPLPLVARAIMSCVPQDFPGRAELDVALKSITDSWQYSPPESQHVWWGEMIIALETSLEKINNGWAFIIQQIVNAKIDYKIFLKD